MGFPGIQALLYGIFQDIEVEDLMNRVCTLKLEQ